MGRDLTQDYFGVTPISSRRNPLVRSVRQLHTASGRRQRLEALLEGTHLLEEALRLGLVPETILATPSWLARHRELISRVPVRSRVQDVTPEVLEHCATTQHPDGVLLTLATASLPHTVTADRHAEFILALDQPQDPGNLGTLLRTALAAGMDEVWIIEGADPWQPKVMRASSGAVLQMPTLRLKRPDILGKLASVKDAGVQVIATLVPGGGNPVVPYWSVDWTRPSLVLLGNEGAGLSAELVAQADHRVTIPHSPRVESLNLAAAAAPLLLERWRSRHGRKPGSSEGENGAQT